MQSLTILVQYLYNTLTKLISQNISKISQNVVDGTDIVDTGIVAILTLMTILILMTILTLMKPM